MVRTTYARVLRRSGLVSLLALFVAAAAGFPRAAAAQPCADSIDFCSSTFRDGILLLRYTGDPCVSSAHGQASGSVTCTPGTGTFPAVARILVTDRANPADVGARRWFDGSVRLGDVFVVNSANAGALALGTTTWAFIYRADSLVQTVSFNTSCDEPLREGDQFGALRLTRPNFPRIPVWAMPYAFNDGSAANPRSCVGSLPPQSDSLIKRARTVSVRFLRDRRVEARRDFGGYRVYRVTVTPDTTKLMLIRRFSRQAGDERTWNFSVVDTTDRSTLPFRCRGLLPPTAPLSSWSIVHDSVVTFVDPDSNGNYVKISCRDDRGQIRPGCHALGDSIFVLVPPPGPHDGFRTWYAVTYEARNQTSDAGYEDLFVPDTLGILGPCATPGNPQTCPNLNSKCYNMIESPVEPTAGPTADLERVGVVPNPFRARERWDLPGGNEVHFINLPAQATILIYTVSGDLVRQLEHRDLVRDFARWDLKNQDGRDVSSGIYMYRIVADTFTYQDRLIVIR